MHFSASRTQVPPCLSAPPIAAATSPAVAAPLPPAVAAPAAAASAAAVSSCAHRPHCPCFRRLLLTFVPADTELAAASQTSKAWHTLAQPWLDKALERCLAPSAHDSIAATDRELS